MGGEHIPQEVMEDTFRGYFKIGDNKLAKDSYLMGCIRDRPVKRKRTKVEGKSARLQYSYVITHGKQEYDVCRRAFASLHGCGLARIGRLVGDKVRSPTNTPVPDKRGKGPSANQIPGDVVDRVHEHIQTLAVTSSHYTRAHSPHRRYLTAEVGSISIRELFFLYCEWLEETYPGVESVKFSYYKMIFTSKYNIVPRMPRTDKCDFCEESKREIEIQVHYYFKEFYCHNL